MEPLRYALYLDKKKTTGKLFRCIPYPKIKLHHFFFLSITISSLLIYNFPYHIYIPLLCGVINLEFFSVYFLREEINNQCLDMESLWEYEFATYGVDINFPYDPLYITESDRYYIFDDHFRPASREKSKYSYKIKTYRKVFYNTLKGHVVVLAVFHITDILILT